MKRKKYENFWLIFINLKAKDGFIFNELVDFEGAPNDIDYKGAWANVIVKADKINDALAIVPKCLDELGFEMVFIDKVENIGSLIENEEVNEKVETEVEWLSKSEFVFKISDKLFPYK